MRWFNKLIAEKYDGSKQRSKVGRPQITNEIVALVIRFKCFIPASNGTVTGIFVLMLTSIELELQRDRCL